MDEMVLYKRDMDKAMCMFHQAVSREISIADISAIIEHMKTFDLLAILIKDPSNENAKSCVREYMSHNPQVPHDFLNKFNSIINLKINLSPNNMGFINQSYNAKVIANNIQPPNRITTLTLESRKQTLDQERNDANTFVYTMRNPPATTVRFKFDNELLKKCINTMGNLNSIISDGNRSNGYVIDEYIRTNITK